MFEISLSEQFPFEISIVGPKIQFLNFSSEKPKYFKLLIKLYSIWESFKELVKPSDTKRLLLFFR